MAALGTRTHKGEPRFDLNVPAWCYDEVLDCTFSKLLERNKHESVRCGAMMRLDFGKQNMAVRNRARALCLDRNMWLYVHV